MGKSSIYLYSKVWFCRHKFSFYSYFSRSHVLWVQLGTRTSPSHGDRTPQPGTDTAGHRKNRRTPAGRLGVTCRHTQTLYFHVQSSSIASFIAFQFPRPYTHSRLSHLAPLQPGSHSQRPVTWWQLELWTQSHLCSQPSPKNPLEQASDKNTRVRFQHTALESGSKTFLMLIYPRLIAQIVLTQKVLWFQE